jgi:hypothetical protein
MEPVVIDMPKVVTGDTWLPPGPGIPGGLNIGPVTFNGTQPEFPLESCKMHFQDSTGKFSYGFEYPAKEGFGLIVVDNAVNWTMHIDPQSIPLKAGIHMWDFKTWDTDGVKRTIYNGTQEILQGIP